MNFPDVLDDTPETDERWIAPLSDAIQKLDYPDLVSPLKQRSVYHTHPLRPNKVRSVMRRSYPLFSTRSMVVVAQNSNPKISLLCASAHFCDKPRPGQPNRRRRGGKTAPLGVKLVNRCAVDGAARTQQVASRPHQHHPVSGDPGGHQQSSQRGEIRPGSDQAMHGRQSR